MWKLGWLGRFLSTLESTMLLLMMCESCVASVRGRTLAIDSDFYRFMKTSVPAAIDGSIMEASISVPDSTEPTAAHSL